ncbi:MAG TPA: PilT/PilU family type 4a pilus ATPase [Candidatus Portnoybacteria bacterium]|nr:PilT/PilU family type 4a pilus ATPase [Candidatus Portnoybacteria bacterium]
MKISPKLSQLIKELLKREATDLHLISDRPAILRINGGLTFSQDQDIVSSAIIDNIIETILNDEQKKRLKEKKDIDLAISFENKARFRINIYQAMGKYSLAMRYISNKIRSIEDLHLPPILHQFARATQGFFLVVGPSGHGKSTALASLLDEINHTRFDHIITIEDPIEYVFHSDKCLIEQREIGVDAKDFHNGLRAMFREDADAIMIGEMRDPETISTALTAAETGHLVLSTLHTNTAAETIDRIITSFPSHEQAQIKNQLASTLVGILSRRLLPSTQGGLINAYEILIANSAIRNLIREGKIYQIPSVMETSSAEGMITLNRCLADLVKNNLITLDQAETHSTNPAELRMILQI